MIDPVYVKNSGSHEPFSPEQTLSTFHRNVETVVICDNRAFAGPDVVRYVRITCTWQCHIHVHFGQHVLFVDADGEFVLEVVIVPKADHVDIADVYRDHGGVGLLHDRHPGHVHAAVFEHGELEVAVRDDVAELDLEAGLERLLGGVTGIGDIRVGIPADVSHRSVRGGRILSASEEGEGGHEDRQHQGESTRHGVLRVAKAPKRERVEESVVGSTRK